MYKLMSYWNRIAYFFIHLGRWMIWDYGNRHSFLLEDENFASKMSEEIMCDR